MLLHFRDSSHPFCRQPKKVEDYKNQSMVAEISDISSTIFESFSLLSNSNMFFTISRSQINVSFSAFDTHNLPKMISALIDKMIATLLYRSICQWIGCEGMTRVGKMDLSRGVWEIHPKRAIEDNGFSSGGFFDGWLLCWVVRGDFEAPLLILLLLLPLIGFVRWVFVSIWCLGECWDWEWRKTEEELWKVQGRERKNWIREMRTGVKERSSGGENGGGRCDVT